MVSAAAGDVTAGDVTAGDVTAGDVTAAAVAVACDFCASDPAVVYCRADSARLCLACDREVHAANTVSSRHHRSLLCDRCAAAPAAIFCPTFPHRVVLCSNCDFNAHQSDDARHSRHALDPFSGCPSGVCLAAALNVGDEKDKIFGEEEEGWDWESPPVFCWEDLILSPTTTPFHGYQAAGMPPPLKDSNSTCGKRKEEIHRQIRQLIIGESDEVDCNEEIVPVMEFTSLPLENLQLQNGSTPVFVETPSCELSFIIGNPMAAGNPIASSLDLNIGNSSLASLPHGRDKDEPDPIIKEKPLSAPLKDELPDRSSVISRYKEKRKTRRYDKLIRYESRKSRADSRVRIKGRFARANEVKNS